MLAYDNMLIPWSPEAIPKNITFRVDANANIGGGHLMRCSTLAEEFYRRGNNCRFWSDRDSAGFVRSWIPDHFPVSDELATCQDIVAIDSYTFDVSQERALRSLAGFVFVIDDLANRPHDCDLLLDQNLGRQGSDYQDLVPRGTRVLAGTEFALLRREFALARKTSLSRRNGDVDRILVSMGMTDVGGLAATVLKAILATKITVLVDVVVGNSAPSLGELHRLAAETKGIEIHVDSKAMDRLMTNADLAIGAAGTTSWERCCLGLPTILTVLAENQRRGAEELERQGAAILTDLSNIGEAFNRLYGDKARVSSISRQAAAVCDGLGTARVADVLEREVGIGLSSHSD